MKYISCLLFVFLLFPAMSTNAQVTYEGCIDFRGQPVASKLDNSINDVAIALIENDHAVIRYNTIVLAELSVPTMRFFYMHECAHHALGHTVTSISLQNENAADCWAINTMKDTLGLSINELHAIQRDISVRGRADWTHLPGPRRAINIDSCLARETLFPGIPKGFPSGHGMQQCSCSGFNPAHIVPEQLCQSGYVVLSVCSGICPMGGSPFAYVCQ